MKTLVDLIIVCLAMHKSSKRQRSRNREIGNPVKYSVEYFILQLSSPGSSFVHKLHSNC